jgi:hypothetical protein
MKNLMLLIFALAIAGCTNAQKVSETELPQAVKDSFQKQFPSAQKIQWGKEGSDYEAEFKDGSEETSAVFDTEGTLKEIEVEMEVAELPIIINDYCTKNFPGYKIGEAAKITDPSGAVNYEAELSKGKEKFDAIFDAQGGFVKKIVEPNGADND